MTSASMTGFNEIPFRILRLGQGADIINDFERESQYVNRHIPGSNTTVTQLLGLGVPGVAWRIECPTIDDCADLEAAQQTTATLRIPHGLTTVAHTEVTLFGSVYDEIADVLLVSVRGKVTRNDGTVQCDVVFQGDWE